MAELQPRRPEKKLEDTRRRISRLIIELAERHSRHVREGKATYTESPYSLLFSLTAGNVKAMVDLLAAEPEFFERHPEVPPVILLDETVKSYFPPEFFTDPTSFIEGQAEVDRGAGSIPRAATNAELMDIVYDVTRVKSFDLRGSDGSMLSVVSRRLDQEALSSVNRQRAAFDAGIPTPQVYGEVLHGENQYALFEKVQGVTVLDAIARCFEPFNDHEGLFNDYEGLIQAPLYSTTRELDYYLSNNSIFKNTELQKKCIAVAQQYEEAIQYAVFCLKNLYKYIKYLLEDRHDYLRNVDIFDGLDVVNAFMLRVAHSLGLASVEDFWNRYRSAGANWEYQWKQDKDVIQADIYSAIEPYEKDWTNVCDEHFFGFPLSARIQELKQLTVEKGIPHKDFADRNIMIEWDFDADAPLVREGETGPRLLLIDWEEK